MSVPLRIVKIAARHATLQVEKIDQISLRMCVRHLQQEGGGVSLHLPSYGVTGSIAPQCSSI
jgi:hypothetical protein